MSRKVALLKRVQPAKKTVRNYWSGLEAEDIIQRVSKGEDIADEAERLDVMVDPETAMCWLRRNNHNRTLSNVTVQRYAADMKNNAWPYTHQGIAFDRNGELLDGQHRLQAIVLSGCTVPMQVTVNMLPEVKRAIDQGKSRTTADVVTLETKKHIEAKIAAIARRMMCSTREKVSGITRTQAVDFIIRHLDAILYSVAQLPQKARLTHAANRAVIARAWYSVEPQTLERFCRVLETGGYAPNEEIIFQLREYTIAKGSRSNEAIMEVYLRTEWVLQKFIKKEPVKRLNKTDVELFKLPEELKQDR